MGDGVGDLVRDGVEIERDGVGVEWSGMEWYGVGVGARCSPWLPTPFFRLTAKLFFKRPNLAKLNIRKWQKWPKNNKRD